MKRLPSSSPSHANDMPRQNVDLLDIVIGILEDFRPNHFEEHCVDHGGASTLAQLDISSSGTSAGEAWSLVSDEDHAARNGI